MNQIERHEKIETLLQETPIGTTEENVSALITVNEDARQFFFTQADKRWLDWLWENGFLDAIKEKSEDPTQYGGHRFPELDYIVRMAGESASKVVDIMLEVPVSADHFNPGVIDRFVRICSTLPAGELARMVPVIRNKKWIPLMGAFNQWGFEYEKMFETLAEANDHESILALAEAILSVRPKEEMKVGISIENPFYFNDLSYTKVFEYLANMGADHAEQALALTTKVIGEIVGQEDKTRTGEVFAVEDTFSLLDVDFFILESGQKERLSHSDDVRELAAVIVAAIKKLSKKTIGSYDTDPFRAKELYKKYFEFLPNSRSMWRLRLFVLTLYPQYFKEELKNAFFRLFKVERYHEIMSGAEYEKALQKGFFVLSEDDRREYVRQTIEYFTKHTEDKKEQSWLMRDGSRILSMIAEHLTEREERQIEEAGFVIDLNYKPESSIGSMEAGTVVPRGPVTAEEFEGLTLAEIAQRLRTDWTPEVLSKQNTNEQFLNPLNAEGVSGLLRADIPKRLQEYVNNAGLFFERDVLDQHYTYSFLRGMQEVIKNNNENVQVDWDGLIDLCVAIKNSGEEAPFDRAKRERDSFDAWLVGWDAVHTTIADAIQELLTERGGSVKIDFKKFREQLFGIVRYLLAHPEPRPADEEPETAIMTTGHSKGDELLVSDPYSIAINTVRGRAFQAFVLFVYRDGKKFGKEDSPKISADVKELYEKTLEKEATRALMSMFGRYLPSFYYRDKEWIQGLLPQIFPTKQEKAHLYIAAWEGYLSENLYEEVFFDQKFQELYKRGLALTGKEDSQRKYFRDLNEGIATHFALAFLHYHDRFGFDHELLQEFWKSNVERHKDFIDFIGRAVISGDSSRVDALIGKDPDTKEYLKNLWDRLLDTYENPELFAAFGFWISLEKNIFEPVWLAERLRKTLEKTEGNLSWDYGLSKSIIELAKNAPKDTLEITRLYLLERGVRKSKLLMPFRVEDDEWFEVFRILYNDSSTKKDTYSLIDDLIREGGSIFWKLKDIVEEGKKKTVLERTG